MELILHISAGALVGFAIGITGVGGGSLMTPLLLFFGYPVPVAIGTDLLYAAITKTGGALSHHRAGNVDWSIVRLLALGSVPTAILVRSAISKTTFQESQEFGELLTFSLGIMLLVTAIILIFKNKLREKAVDNKPPFIMNFIQRRRSTTYFFDGNRTGGLRDAIFRWSRRIRRGDTSDDLLSNQDCKDNWERHRSRSPAYLHCWSRLPVCRLRRPDVAAKPPYWLTAIYCAGLALQ